MPETLGTLDLKIARLEQYLDVLKQQLAMSDQYPTHKANLIHRVSQIRFQRHQLIRNRQQLVEGVLISSKG